MMLKVCFGIASSCLVGYCFVRKKKQQEKKSKENLSRLSVRGKKACAAPVSYLPLFLDSLANQYDSKLNPDGVVVLGVAENKLSFETDIRPKLKECREITKDIPCYDNFAGQERFRNEVAKLMSRKLAHRTLDSDCICVASGCGAVINILFFSICNPKDVVLIPAVSVLFVCLFVCDAVLFLIHNVYQ